MATSHIFIQSFWLGLSPTQKFLRVMFLIMLGIGIIVLNSAILDDWFVDYRAGIYGTSSEKDKFDIRVDDELMIVSY